jgi:MFS family permease
MGATHNAAGLIATRFFLGFGEAAVAPGFSLITSMWYKKSEQPLRHGIWFLGNVCSGFFGGPLMYAFDHVETFSPWRVRRPCSLPPAE